MSTADRKDREDQEAEESGGADSSLATRFVPGARLPGLAALGLPLALLDGGTGLGLLAAAGYDGVLGLGAWVESRALRRRKVTARRSLPPRLVVGVPNTVTLHLHNPFDVTAKVRVRDAAPPGFAPDPDELEVDLPPFARREVTYEVTPPRRGAHTFGDIFVRSRGLLGLAAVQHRIPSEAVARVYPGVLGTRGDLNTRMNELRVMGLRDIRVLGGGGEFAQLREYVAGDPFRSLDWKSTAKRRRPVTRVYQQERSQHVMICVDVGRMMAAQLDVDDLGDDPEASDGEAGRPPLTKLDHAVRAALLLAWVALRGGDRVGLIVFGEGVKAFVPPGHGMPHYRRLLQALFDVQAEPTFVDFRRLVTFVQTRVKRRSLLVLFSDLLDEHHAMPLAKHAGLLRRKHLPLCVTIHDPVAAQLAEAPANSVADVYSRTAAVDLLADRERVKAHLRKNAVDLVEAPVGDLAVATVRRYIEIKSHNRL